jgi:hypothetical protein
MPEKQKLVKAQLIEVIEDSKGNETGRGLITVPVQFNPQSLKLNFANQTDGKKPQGTSEQYTGTGTSKLTMELWFDVTRPLLPAPPPAKPLPDPNGDVRNLTKWIMYFMIVANPHSTKQADRVPPRLKFQWGSFTFYGAMDSMDETIDLFSPDGLPLRSSVSISISKHDLWFQFPQPDGPLSNVKGPPPGREAVVTLVTGDSVPQVAAKAGITNWQPVAQANGIANPRLTGPGPMVNLAKTT